MKSILIILGFVSLIAVLCLIPVMVAVFNETNGDSDYLDY